MSKTKETGKGKAAAEPKAPKAKAEVKLTACGCGCGAMVPRRYKQGHDARHKGALVNAALGGDQKAERTLTDLGWLGWLTKARDSRKAKAEAKARADEKRATEKAAAAAKAAEAKAAEPKAPATNGAAKQSPKAKAQANLAANRK